MRFVLTDRPFKQPTGGAKAVGAAVTLYTLLLAGGKYSGAHYNPIVTFGCA